ncbi:rod shape-determining protein MreC [Acaryochloris sp. IP29b_bin.137]|uniref:rod shape-determining protein MreC n=1 Tax=Acaryochloris sp. IP29b_bin.137 TaxID=2969217 RepID=UPI002601CFB6|nr:rod shape-determining protein MreC [Acaryochloris sp. IP29b_bin.137]
MLFLFRWWERYRLGLILAILCLGGAWIFSRSQGVGLLEVFRFISGPAQTDAAKQKQLVDAQTVQLRQQMADLKSRNQTLQELLDQDSVQNKQAIAVQILGRSADNWWQQLTLSKGRTDGIDVGSVVFAPGGLVGRVTAVSQGTSRVLLISDPTSRIGVIVSRSRHMGILQGQSSTDAIVTFFDKDPDVKVGDAIVTSSLSRLFPPGLLVGKIKTLKLEQNYNPQATVELAVPISKLEWVTVYLNDQTASLQKTVPANP